MLMSSGSSSSSGGNQQQQPQQQHQSNGVVGGTPGNGVGGVGGGGVLGGGGATASSVPSSDRAFIRKLLSSRNGGGSRAGGGTGRRAGNGGGGLREDDDQAVKLALEQMSNDPNVPMYQYVLMETLVLQQSEIRAHLRRLVDRDAARAADDGRERSSMEESDVLADPGPSEDGQFGGYNGNHVNGLNDSMHHFGEGEIGAYCQPVVQPVVTPLPSQYTRVRRGRNSRPLPTSAAAAANAQNNAAHSVTPSDYQLQQQQLMQAIKSEDTTRIGEREEEAEQPFGNGQAVLESLLAATYQPQMNGGGVEEGCINQGGHEGEGEMGASGSHHDEGVRGDDHMDGNQHEDPTTAISEQALKLLQESSGAYGQLVKPAKKGKKGKKRGVITNPVVLGEKIPGGDEVKFLGGSRIGNGLQCGVCGLFVRHVTRLREHMTTHTGEKNFCCPACPMRFGRKDSMHAHYKRIHERQAAAMAQMGGQLEGGGMMMMEDGQNGGMMPMTSTAHASAIAPLNLPCAS